MIVVKNSSLLSIAGAAQILLCACGISIFVSSWSKFLVLPAAIIALTFGLHYWRAKFECVKTIFLKSDGCITLLMGTGNDVKELPCMHADVALPWVVSLGGHTSEIGYRTYWVAIDMMCQEDWRKFQIAVRRLLNENQH